MTQRLALPRLSLVVALLTASAGVGAACTHDFDAFEPGEPEGAPAEGGSDATTIDATDARADASTGGDASCAAAGQCATTLTSCKGTCETTRTNCRNACKSGDFVCRNNCDRTRDTCTQQCTSTCRSCAGTCTVSCN